jgi:hypothetical protein
MIKSCTFKKEKSYFGNYYDLKKLKNSYPIYTDFGHDY